MKQLDTIKNHEWIPTELDLENMPRVTSALPTASAQNLGIVYLLDAEQLGYVRSHFYKCILEDGIYKWFDLQVGRFAIGNCRNIQLKLLDDGVALKLLIAWEDPDDVVVGDETTRWAKTVLVHQVGHMPLTVEDGVVLITNTTRNVYSKIGSLSFTIQDNTTSKHYFKLFPYSDDGAITNDDQNGRVAGWNYAVTGDLHPYVINNEGEAEYTKDYYSRVLNPETGLYEYTKLAFNSTNFTDNAGKWEFKSGMTYYVYENCLMNWAGIRELVRNGTAESFFPCGTIFMLPYHGDYGTMAFEVVDHDNVEAYYGGIAAHTMTLQAKYLYEWWDQNNIGYVFDAEEAAAATTKDTSRNTDKMYHISVGSNNYAITLAPSGVNVQAANSGGNVYNINWVATVASKAGQRIYPASHWDTTGRPLEKTEVFHNSSANAFQMRVPVINYANSTTPSFVECELSYLPYDTCGCTSNRTRRSFLRSVYNNSTYYNTNIDTESSEPKAVTITNASYNQDFTIWPWFYPGIPSLVSTDAQFFFSTDTGSRKYGKPYGTTRVFRTAEHYMHPLEKFAQDGVTYYTKDGDTFTEDDGVEVGDDVSEKYVLTVRQVVQINNGGVLSVAAMPTGKPNDLGNSQKITVTSSSNTSPEAGYVYFYSQSVTEPDTSSAKTRFIPILELDVTDGLLKWCVNRWGTQASYTLYKLDAASVILETYIHNYNPNISTAGTAIGAATLTSGTSALSSSDGAYEIRDANVVGSTWGAYTTNLAARPWLFVFGPRNNGYADTYTRVPYVGGWRGFDPKIKYYAPVGHTRQLTMSNFNTAKTTHTYAYTRGTKFRDITKDIADTIFQLVTDTKDENNLVTVNGQKVSPLTYLPELSATSLGKINLTQICKDLVLIPSMDARFIPGKKYYRAQYTELVANGTNTWPSHGIFVRKQTRLIGVPGHQREVTTYVRCNKGTGTISYPYNGSYDTIYKVSFLPMTEHAIADGETAHTTRQTYNAGDDACASGGLHYVTGDMIPTRSLTPLYCIRREHVVNGVTYHEGDYRPVDATVDGTQRRSSTGYYKKVDDEYVALGASEDPNGGETAVGGTWQGQAYICYAGGCPEPACYIWSCDGGITECDVDCAGQSTSDHNGTAGALSGYPGYPAAYVDTDIYQGCISDYTPTPGGTTYEEVQLYWQMPNTERTAYGNHVWSQSNARAYLNGPFDNATEYVPTNDASFISNRRYYEFVAGSGYVEISSARFTTLKNEGITIYTKLDNGLPVGVKLDINNPSRYWNYGISARMQYKFVNNDWVPAFEETDLWWGEAMKSVNNGLQYDRLAGMYCYSYVSKGATGNSSYTVTSLTARGAGTNNNNASYVAVGSAVKVKDTGNNVIGNLTTVHLLPRQSFLHGFIDCRYKRTSDTSLQDGKTYYMRNPYGEYIQATGLTSGTDPYNNCLYEENPGYKADIQDAYEFLSAICPVINRNGLYGTTGAYDLYPRGDPATKPNLGGTTTVDKVWLASTNQVAGGNSANNGVREEWSGASSGKYGTLANVFEIYGLSSTQTAGYYMALEKYAICKTYASIVFGYAGSGDTGLNNSRIRYAYVNGVHTSSGYTDKLGGAQYWWLRSAGGCATKYEHTFQVIREVRANGTNVNNESTLAMPYGKDSGYRVPLWLSPLITIG